MSLFVRLVSVITLGENRTLAILTQSLMSPRVFSCLFMCRCALQLRLCAGHGPEGPQCSECCWQGRGGSTPGKDCHASNSSGDKGPKGQTLLDGLAHWLLGLLVWYCFNMFQSITGRITSAVWLLANAWIYMIFDGIAAGFEWRLSLEQSTRTKKIPIPHSDLELRWKLRFHRHRWLHQYDWLLIGLCPLISVYVCQIIVILVRLWAGHILDWRLLVSEGRVERHRAGGPMAHCRDVGGESRGLWCLAKKARRSF